MKIYYVTDGTVMYTVRAASPETAEDFSHHKTVILEVCRADDPPGVELAPDDVQMRYNTAARPLPGFDI